VRLCFCAVCRRLLANPAGETGAQVRRRFTGLLAAMQRHRHRVGGLGSAVDHFRKVARSYWPGLFHAATIPDLPRTNNGLEPLLSYAGVWVTGAIRRRG
jgi:hypothetical protein